MLYTFLMSKDLRLIGLFGLYKNMLTENQKDLFNLYYECDLSLGEIAEIKGVSRQSVNDGLRKAKEMLSDTEARLGFYERFAAAEKILDKAESGEISVSDAAKEIRDLLEEY
ncbi:MAG: DNA-binding protein [Clostridia bacterium]|nr:DNA-binding protein [Clostridia bacterium]